MSGESEVKFAVSESSRPGPSAQFPVLLGAPARVVTERASPGETREVAAVGQDGAKGCVQKREHLPRDGASSPALGTRTYCPAAGAGWSQV